MNFSQTGTAFQKPKHDLRPTTQQGIRQKPIDGVNMTEPNSRIVSSSKYTATHQQMPNLRTST